MHDDSDTYAVDVEIAEQLAADREWRVLAIIGWGVALGIGGTFVLAIIFAAGWCAVHGCYARLPP